MQQEYVVVQELKSSPKLTGKWFVRDALFVLAYLLIAFMFDEMVHPLLQGIYYIFNVIVACVLTAHIPGNPQKRVYHLICYWIIKKRCIYHSI